MTQTTSAINSCDAQINLDNSAGTLTNISGSSSKVSPSFETMEGVARTLDGSWPIRLLCKRDATFSLSIVYSTTADEGMDLLLDWWFGAAYNAGRSMRLDLPDATAGSDRFQGEVKLINFSWDVDAEEAGPILVEAEVKIHGELTRTAIAS